METNKQKAIREAYGKYWELFNSSAKDCAFNNNGWISAILEHAPKDLEIDFYKSAFRPKTLQGIETNNNWISILSESDLPIEDCDCHIEFEDGAISIDRYFVFGKNFTSNHWKHIVAYRLIEKPNKRIY